MVTDSKSQPVAGAYVIGAASMVVTRTGPDGRYSRPCQAEVLVASPWVVPMTTAGPRTPPTAACYGRAHKVRLIPVGNPLGEELQ